MRAGKLFQKIAKCYTSKITELNLGNKTIDLEKNMNKNIEDKHKIIIDIGRSGDTMSLNVNELSDYHKLAAELLLHPLPAGKENRHNFIKGLILLENKLNPVGVQSEGVAEGGRDKVRTTVFVYSRLARFR